MKHLSILTLLMGILCLVGCSKEEVPQNVAFDKDQITITSRKQSVPLNIQADCPWVLHQVKGDYTVTKASGEGPMSIHVNIPENKEYDGTEHILEIYSENRKSSDRLVINQWPKLKTSVQTPSMLSCEGGEFEVKIKSSDTLSDVETPDWIAFNASRAMKDYVYVFTAEPNKTGSPREGTVWLKGLDGHEGFDVKQDSYAPTGASISDAPEYVLTDETVSFDILPEPEYSDDSKLSVKVLFGEKEIKSTYTNRTLKFNPNESGEYTLEFYNGYTLLETETVKALESKVDVSLSCGETCLIGDTINVRVDIPMDMCAIKIDDGSDILKKVGDTRYVVTGEGYFAFTATNVLTGYTDKTESNAVLFTTSSWVKSEISPSSGQLVATFYTEVSSNSDMYFSNYFLYGPDGYLVMKGNVQVTNNWTYIFTKSFEIPVVRGTYTIWVEITIDGETKYAISDAVVR